MRIHLLTALLLSVVCSAHAQGDATTTEGRGKHHPKVSSRQCGLATPFNVLADSGGIWLYRDSGVPREIFFHGGRLSIDQSVQQVSDADARRLWDMEREARVLMPQVAGIAHDVVDISYDALGGVIEVMTGSWLNARRIERMRGRANAYVEDTLGKGRWDQQAFDGNFERHLEEAIEQFTGSIARHAMFQVLTGRANRLEARADAMGDVLETKLEAKSHAIEARAEALCAQVERLRHLQDALEFRYHGQPLQMLASLPDSGDVLVVDGGDDDSVDDESIDQSADDRGGDARSSAIQVRADGGG